jgi:hypothetical protein
MASVPGGVAIGEIPRPGLSLTSVRWMTEIPDPEDSSIVEAVEMFTVVGEQYRLDSVEAALKAIEQEFSFLPPRFWLVPDNNNSFDPLAVAVYAISGGNGYHVGFLPKDQARQFRDSMVQLSRDGQSLEVLGCITQGKSSPHPNGRIYLPVEFAKLCASGYSSDEANRISWVEDATPVVPRAATGSPGDVFTFEELCKIYCWYARKRRWFCFPHDCESKAEGVRSAGIGLPRADFEPFMTAQSAAVAKESAPAERKAQAEPASQWFFAKDGREYGPFDAAGLREAARSGQLRPTDQVRRGDLAQWAAASRVKGLFAEGAVAPSGKSAEPSLATLLFQQADLPVEWSVGPFEPSAPQMFEKIKDAKMQGSYPLLFKGNRKGGVTGFVFQNASDAMRCYDEVRSTFSKNAGIVARLGDAARFSYMHMEMPPQLKLPPTENTDLVFVRGTVVVHIRMGDSPPDPAVNFAVKIDSRVGSFG